MNQAIDTNMSEVSIIYDLLSVTCDNTLYWSKVEWRVHSWSQLKWYIWSIDVTSVEEALTLVTENERPGRRIWVSVHLVTSAEGTNSLETHVVLVAL